MGRVTSIAGVVALLAGTSSATASLPQQHVPVQLVLRPAVVLRGHAATVTVLGVDAPTLEARAAGATMNLGKRVPWTHLRFANGAWHGVLPASELRGVYPLELRVKRGAPILRSSHWVLRVFARGTLSRPAFDTPEGAARWWLRTLPSHPTLVAMKRWPRPAYDLRDPRLHQLLVLAYSRAGRPAVRDRLGMFVTAVRDSVHGSWRLLEATAVP